MDGVCSGGKRKHGYEKRPKERLVTPDKTECIQKNVAQYGAIMGWCAVEEVYALKARDRDVGETLT